MPRRVVNVELAQALAPYTRQEEVVRGVTAALGVYPGDSLDPNQYPVEGFFLKSSATVFSFYAVVGGRFVVYETVPSGDSLTLTFPLGRVRRLVEEMRGDDITVTVELDSDKSVTVSNTEYLESDAPNGQKMGRSVGRSEASFSSYVLTAQFEEEAGSAEQLLDFALAVRNAI